jgi:hypothetical protein
VCEHVVLALRHHEACTSRKTGRHLDSVAYLKRVTVVTPLNFNSMAHFNMHHRIPIFLAHMELMRHKNLHICATGIPKKLISYTAVQTTIYYTLCMKTEIT